VNLVTVDGNVYKCSEVQFVNTWCGHSSYKPGNSQFWEQAWTLLGSCTGTIAPSASPISESITDAGGCPGASSSDVAYTAGDKVEMNGLAYKCRAWPHSTFCSRATYEPDGDTSANLPLLFL
jgi:hypothetical protein